MDEINLLISQTPKKIVGFKQTMHAIQKGKCEKVVLAEDCDLDFKKKIVAQCAKENVEIIYVPTKNQLALMCLVTVPTGVVALLKN